LKNAREQIGTVYVPLSANLAALKAASQDYVHKGKRVEQQAVFNVQVDKFVSELHSLERIPPGEGRLTGFRPSSFRSFPHRFESNGESQARRDLIH